MNTTPYGEWPSPLAPLDLTRGLKGYLDPQVDGEALYWLESRPDEGGRNVVMRLGEDGAAVQVTPDGFNVRSRVHEYGGGAYLAHGGAVYFTNFEDQRIYRQRPGEAPTPITPTAPLRYAEYTADDARGRLICVREDHRAPGEPRNTLVAIETEPEDPETNAGVELFAAADFVSSAALSADGGQLAWLSWQHPNMPWDSVQLWRAAFADDGTLGQPELINPDMDEAVMQPCWIGRDVLLFISDRDGWWNFYRWTAGEVQRVHEHALEVGWPAWNLGTRSYSLTDSGDIITYVNEGGLEGLARIAPADGSLTRLQLPLVGVGGMARSGDTVFLSAGFADRPGGLYALSLADDALDIVAGNTDPGMPAGCISHPRPIEFPTTDGAVAHGFYFPPTSEEHAAPRGERPPLILMAHGGPTIHATGRFSRDLQFWTSRGFAVFELNYRGSSGFGRDYRKSLYGRWGEADVDDAVHAAAHLVADQLADPERLLIRGGSAGGFLVLAAMAFHDTFKAGANYYGISDLEVLASDTHKFESRYTDQLVGPYPAQKHLYQERSPIHALDGFNAPLITLQGLEDVVVPPSQSEMIVNALRNKGVPVAYLPFEGEQHGFRKAENIARSREAELYFYGRVLGFTPAGELAPVAIDNLTH